MTKIKYLTFLTLVMLGHLCFSQEDTALYKQATTYFDKSEFKLTIEFCTKAILINKDFKNAYFQRAMSYINMNDYKNATSDFDKVLKLDSLDSRAYNGRGMLYFKQKRYSEALLCYNKAIQLDSLNCEAFNNRGAYYAYKYNYKSSLIDLLAAVKIGKKTNSVKYYFYCNLADTYFNLKEYSKSIEVACKAIEMENEISDAYTCRAAAYDKLGRYDEADIDYKKARKFKKTRLYNAD